MLTSACVLGVSPKKSAINRPASEVLGIGDSGGPFLEVLDIRFSAVAVEAGFGLATRSLIDFAGDLLRAGTFSALDRNPALKGGDMGYFLVAEDPLTGGDSSACVSDTPERPSPKPTALTGDPLGCTRPALSMAACSSLWVGSLIGDGARTLDPGSF